MRVENERQTPSAPFWMGCPRELERPTEPRNVLPPKEELDVKPPPSESSTASMCSITLLSVLTLHCMITLGCQL